MDLKYTTHSQFYSILPDEAEETQIHKNDKEVILCTKVKQWVTYRYRPRIIRLTQNALKIKATDEKNAKEEEIPISEINVIEKTNKKQTLLSFHLRSQANGQTTNRKRNKTMYFLFKDKEDKVLWGYTLLAQIQFSMENDGNLSNKINVIL